jgi:hypothetical protein
MQVDGEIQLTRIHVEDIAGEGVKAKDFAVTIDDFPIDTLLLPQLDTASFGISHRGREAQGQIDTLDLEQANIKSEVWLRDVDLEDIDMTGLHVGGMTAFDPNITIDGSLNITDSHLGSFTWKLFLPSQEWPIEIRSSGTTFDDLDVSDDHGKANLNTAFLKRARSSESGYTTYEHMLRDRGEFTEADAIYSGLHEKLRSETWLTSQGSLMHRLSAVAFIILDLAQALFLGYGRFPLPPIIWSAVFIIAGTLLFRRVRMEQIRKDETNSTSYSEFWYSLELFLPVVDLGMAKSWRPEESRKSICTYARIHQLAGWILIPVFLAAVTGVIK